MKENELLKKYMAHVLDSEGVTFVLYINDPHSSVEFTDEEISILKKLEDEIKKTN